MIIIKCDTCHKELTEQEIQYCHEMIGYGVYCKKHTPKPKHVIYTNKGIIEEMFEEEG